MTKDQWIFAFLWIVLALFAWFVFSVARSGPSFKEYKEKCESKGQNIAKVYSRKDYRSSYYVCVGDDQQGM